DEVGAQDLLLNEQLDVAKIDVAFLGEDETIGMIRRLISVFIAERSLASKECLLVHADQCVVSSGIDLHAQSGGKAEVFKLAGQEDRKHFGCDEERWQDRGPE